ncbi:vitamin K epoxide reductase family protein [Pseudanabaena sp. FACHB-2040]|uniref:vitamin K epoxide reductase family protein n=1 Tax=Pseudanabaena sp. FACHB-2040 TaxID=2692859 RepID=UPI001683DC12|nr:vitamin K epoxide reductase family protein [Pseudanabaena sp. FACHB-2040]MBD2260097.1 vitamin K epoxide reductase family protein [Pseudanabaena sp. FACHB-2040]
MDPQQLSRELREGTSPDLQRRRQIIGLSMLGATMGQLVSLYQTGIIKHLPDPPVSIFDADKVDSSEYAYKRLDTPDGLMMVTTYALTAWLAGAGGEDRAKTQPLLPIAMGAKLLLDIATNVKLASEEWQENKALCEYCQLASLASLASFAIALPEITTAVQTLMGDSK